MKSRLLPTNLILITLLFTGCQNIRMPPAPEPSHTVSAPPASAAKKSIPTAYASLTPLPVQLWSMTNIARLAPYDPARQTPIRFYTPTFVPFTPDLIAPTRTQAATTSPTILAAGSPTPICLAAYPDFCIASGGPRYTCDELGSNGFTVLPPDPLDYDDDDDGVGCED